MLGRGGVDKSRSRSWHQAAADDLAFDGGAGRSVVHFLISLVLGAVEVPSSWGAELCAGRYGWKLGL